MPDVLREKQPRLGTLMDISRDDAPACMPFPREHRAPTAAANPRGGVHRKLKRRNGVIGILPDDGACSPLRLLRFGLLR